MQIFPGVTFRYGMCARGAPSAYLRVDLMSVPSLRRDNASAYAIHLWTKVIPAFINFNVSHRLWSASVREAAEDTACLLVMKVSFIPPAHSPVHATFTL